MAVKWSFVWAYLEEDVHLRECCTQGSHVGRKKEDKGGISNHEVRISDIRFLTTSHLHAEDACMLKNKKGFCHHISHSAMRPSQDCYGLVSTHQLPASLSLKQSEKVQEFIVLQLSTLMSRSLSQVSSFSHSTLWLRLFACHQA